MLGDCINRRKKIICLIFIICSGFLMGQDKQSLENKRDEYLEKIKLANDLLKSTKSKKTATTANLKLIINKIEVRKLLIKNIENEITGLNERIDNNYYVISSLENDIIRLKKEYEKLIYYAYRNHKTTNLWLFVFASETFNQAYRRYKYLIEYTKYRKKQKELIISIQYLIENKNNDLINKRKKKQDLLFAYSKESDNLRREIYEKENLISSLKVKERHLKREIEINKKNAKKIAEEIRILIEKEQKRNSSDKESDKIISNEFRNSMGKLQWPVKSGIIINEYGEHYHPVLKEVKLNNPGIDISTNRNADIYAVYDGEVSGVYGIMGTNNTVIIKHGGFFTVYQNVVDLKVKIGTKLKKGDIIGKVFTDTNTNSTVLHFQIWEGKNTVNPYKWIIK